MKPDPRFDDSSMDISGSSIEPISAPIDNCSGNPTITQPKINETPLQELKNDMLDVLSNKGLQKNLLGKRSIAGES